ncbi:MAG: class I SAM-dependent RNA methyltransferase [Bryobacteraceae bacterium]
MPPPDTGSSPSCITIEKLVYGGDALSRVNGQVLLVPFALPGEEVEVTTARAKGKILRGFNPRVVSTSPHRVQPACEYFGRCGGCHYQHAEYDYQLEQKAAILRETLTRLGRITLDDNIPILSAEPWQYRNRIQLHFDRRNLGFLEMGSQKLCPVTHCPISSPKLNTVIAALNQAVTRPEWPAFLRGLEIFTNESDVQLNVTDSSRPLAARFFSWCAELIPGFQPTSINYEVLGQTFRISRGTFFQVNRFLIEKLVDEVTGPYAGDTAIDLYAGAGLFSLPLAKRFRSVVAVERNTAAHRDLEYNASPYQGVITAIQSPGEEFLEQLSETPDLIVADPPRPGLTRSVSSRLLAVQPPKIVVVSCDPATLARDLETLTRSYQIRRVALIDLFPQTFHFETVVHLELKR